MGEARVSARPSPPAIESDAAEAPDAALMQQSSGARPESRRSSYRGDGGAQPSRPPSRTSRSGTPPADREAAGMLPLCSGRRTGAQAMFTSAHDKDAESAGARAADVSADIGANANALDGDEAKRRTPRCAPNPEKAPSQKSGHAKADTPGNLGFRLGTSDIPARKRTSLDALGGPCLGLSSLCARLLANLRLISSSADWHDASSARRQRRGDHRRQTPRSGADASAARRPTSSGLRPSSSGLRTRPASRGSDAAQRLAPAPAAATLGLGDSGPRHLASLFSSLPSALLPSTAASRAGPGAGGRRYSNSPPRPQAQSSPPQSHFLRPLLDGAAREARDAALTLDELFVLKHPMAAPRPWGNAPPVGDAHDALFGDTTSPLTARRFGAPASVPKVALAPL
ncbi:hypothetical protein M885DRAFT_530739 [Pelagophyceae sp. CCMP2097]|nr:hypothetical protein M885DRAFT_530739 [Pelagophyceae sp. CCMP2097]